MVADAFVSLGGRRPRQPRDPHLLCAALRRGQTQEGRPHRVYAKIAHDAQCDAQTSHTLAAGGGATCLSIKTVADTFVLLMRPGETLSSSVTLPNEQCIEVPQTVLRWSSGQGSHATLHPNEQILLTTETSIRVCIHRPAHTPGEALAVALTVAIHAAAVDIHNPSITIINSTRGRRPPVIGREDSI